MGWGEGGGTCSNVFGFDLDRRGITNSILDIKIEVNDSLALLWQIIHSM